MPKVDSDKCNECGMCIDACPGSSVDSKELNLKIFGTEVDNDLLGNYLNCYVGYSTNNDIRYNSTSGGLVTQLLIFALKNKVIDGVLVSKMDDKSPLRAHPFIARTKEEILTASKSKYCPIPVNCMLREILKAKSDEKFAVVGLPCHIHGIRKAAEINNKLKNIVLCIGLFCNHVPTFLATDFLLKQLGVDKENVSKLDYRGNGWPGGMTIALKDGNKIFVPHFYSLYWGVAFKLFFFSQRCIFCSDKLCELADLSCGDAWLPEMANDMMGASLVISRSKISEEILHNALEIGAVAVKKVAIDTVSRSQSIDAVKRRVNARMRLFSIFGKRVPFFNQQLPEPNLFDYFIVVVFYALNSVFSRKGLWRLTKSFSVLLGHSPMTNYSVSSFFVRRD